MCWVINTLSGYLSQLCHYLQYVSEMTYDWKSVYDQYDDGDD